MAEGFYGCFGNFGMYGGNMFFNWLTNILIVVGLVLLIVWVIKGLDNKNKKRRRTRK